MCVCLCSLFALIPLARGGGELGSVWYTKGNKLNKKNSFLDFISCAEYLVEQAYTQPKLLVAKGVSAGGLLIGTHILEKKRKKKWPVNFYFLIGACANMRPDLFGALVLKVPFLDITTTMLDTSLPLTLHEYDEWGDPNEKPFFEYPYSFFLYLFYVCF